MRFFKEVAQKWGNVDPKDDRAIEKWFIEEFPKLPQKTLNDILDELIQYNSEREDEPDLIIYPTNISLPLMKDNVPATGFLWRNYYKLIIRYIQNLIKSKNSI